jgi:anti-sigma factor RsiW
MSTDFECKGGDDAAAYALGALDAKELAVFQRHLETCIVCREEVQSHQQLTDVLGMAVAQYPAPKALRQRVMADVRADAARHLAARDFSQTRAPAGRWVGGLRLGGGMTRAVGPARRGTLIGSAVAVVLVLVVVLFGITASNSKRATTAGAHVFAASVGSAQVLVSAGHGVLIVKNLQQLPVTNTYEVWEKRATGAPQPTSVLFNTSSTGASAVNVPGSLQGVKEILVTKEAAGGSAKPTTKPVVVARIS